MAVVPWMDDGVGGSGFWAMRNRWWAARVWWWRCGGGGKTNMNRTRNSKDQDATTSTRHDDADTNSTMQKLKRKDAKARIVSGKRSTLIFLAFSRTVGQTDAIYTRKTVRSHRET